MRKKNNVIIEIEQSLLSDLARSKFKFNIKKCFNRDLDFDGLLTRKQALEKLSVSSNELLRLTKIGHFNPVKVDNSLFYLKEEIHEYLNPNAENDIQF